MWINFSWSEWREVNRLNVNRRRRLHRNAIVSFLGITVVFKCFKLWKDLLVLTLWHDDRGWRRSSDFITRNTGLQPSRWFLRPGEVALQFPKVTVP